MKIGNLMKMLCGVLAVSLTLVIGGCGNTSSSSVQTSDLDADVRVVADGTGSTKVTVALSTGGILGDGVFLSGSDRLVAFANGVEKTLVLGNLGVVAPKYEAVFDFDSVNIEFRVVLQRSTDFSAPSSTAFLPEPFSVINADNRVYARDEDIVVLWEPAFTDNMGVQFSLECFRADGSNYFIVTSRSGNNGMLVINAGEFLDDPTGDYDSSGGCNVVATLRRSVRGTLDPHFDGGFVTGSQERTLTLRIAEL
jgi:hypothetical protein